MTSKLQERTSNALFDGILFAHVLTEIKENFPDENKFELEGLQTNICHRLKAYPKK